MTKPRKGPVALNNQVKRFITGEAQGTQSLSLKKLLHEMCDTSLPYEREIETDLIALAMDIIQEVE